MPIRNYLNSVSPTSLTSPATNSATSLTVASTTGFPSVPFTIGIDRGTANEEFLLVTATTATTMTVVRGYNATVATAHDAGAAVEHCVGAIDYFEANRHIESTDRDDHPQYMNYARASAYFPKWFNGSSPVSLDPIGPTFTEVNRVTIPSATFARRVQVVSAVAIGPVVDNVVFFSRISRSGVTYGQAVSLGAGLTTLNVMTDWLSLPANTSHTYQNLVRRQSGSGGPSSSDANENKITALVVPA